MITFCINSAAIYSQIHINTLKIISLKNATIFHLYAVVLCRPVKVRSQASCELKYAVFFLNVANYFGSEHPTQRQLLLALVWSWTRKGAAILQLPKALLLLFVDTCPTSVSAIAIQFNRDTSINVSVETAECMKWITTNKKRLWKKRYPVN